MIPIKECYWKSVNKSSSPEAETYRRQHPEIPHNTCRDSCSGYDLNCCLYSDSSTGRAGRLEDIDSQL